MQKVARATPNVTTSVRLQSLGDRVLSTEGRVPMHTVLFALQCYTLGGLCGMQKVSRVTPAARVAAAGGRAKQVACRPT